MGIRYERAYVDFFEDELVLKGYDWRKVVEQYLFSGDKPVGKCLVSGRTSVRACNDKAKLTEVSRSWPPANTPWLRL